MGYHFGVPGGPSHRRVLIEILHRMRWSDEMPERFEGLDTNLLLETVVDQLNADERESVNHNLAQS